MTKDGASLVVGQMGEMNVPGDSLLCMYDAATGKLQKSLKTGLHDIAGLAYSPKNRQALRRRLRVGRHQARWPVRVHRHRRRMQDHEDRQPRQADRPGL